MSYDPIAMYSPPRPGMEDVRPAGQTPPQQDARNGQTSQPSMYLPYTTPLTLTQLVQFLRHNGIDCAKWSQWGRRTKRGIVNGWLGRRYPSPDAGAPLANDSINQAFLRSEARFVEVVATPALGVGSGSAAIQASTNRVISEIDQVIERLDAACASAAWNAAYGPQAASTSIHAKAPLPAGQAASQPTGTDCRTGPTYGILLVAFVAGIVAGPTVHDLLAELLERAAGEHYRDAR